MEKLASQLLQQFNDPAALRNVLAAAGGSGLLGGLVTAETQQRPGETPAGRRWRILRNALMTAAAGGGAMALGQGGAKELSHALPAADRDPVLKTIESPSARAGFGAATLYALNKGQGGSAQKAREMLLHNMTTSGADGVIPEAGAAVINKLKSNAAGLTPGMLADPEQGKIIRDSIRDMVSKQAPNNTLDRMLATKLPVIGAIDPNFGLRNELLHAGLPSTVEDGVGAAAVAQNPIANEIRRGLYKFLSPAFGSRLAAPTEGMLERMSPLGRTAAAVTAAAYAPQAVEGLFGGIKSLVTGGNGDAQ